MCPDIKKPSGPVLVTAKEQPQKATTKNRSVIKGLHLHCTSPNPIAVRVYGRIQGGGGGTGGPDLP